VTVRSYLKKKLLTEKLIVKSQRRIDMSELHCVSKNYTDVAHYNFND